MGFFYLGGFMNKDLQNILLAFAKECESVDDDKALNDIRVKYLGKNGIVTDALKKIKDIPSDQKRAYGEEVNNVKKEIEAKLDDIKEVLAKKEIEKALYLTEHVDLTRPSSECVGSLHPITIVQKKVIDIFTSMGFAVEDGHEIETEYNNFESVNVPKNHPARDMQDTFYLENGEVLKTQTSAGQNRIMRKYGAPLRVIFPGRCFRNEELDASHDNTFFQLEGMVIDKNINISNLIYFMKTTLSQVFGKEMKVRLRPGFFPFVEPGFELDCSCPFCDGKGCRTCKQGGWIELCPCGMIHPEVLRMGGIDPEEYQGFAFGMGFTRLAMMTFDINDIRIMNSGKLDKLSQAKLK